MSLHGVSAGCSELQKALCACSCNHLAVNLSRDKQTDPVDWLVSVAQPQP